MKKGEVYEGIIEQVDFPNKGRVMVDGQPVIVKNGMPGQRVRFMINKKEAVGWKQGSWKCWSRHRLRRENRSVPSFHSVADVCTRPWTTAISWR